MSIFKNIFGNNDEVKSTSKLNWKQLSNLGQLNEITELSEEKAVVIFKHSTTCSISRMVLRNFENEYNQDNNLEIYFLDLLKNRDISNEIRSALASKDFNLYDRVTD